MQQVRDFAVGAAPTDLADTMLAAFEGFESNNFDCGMQSHASVLNRPAQVANV